MQVRAAILAHFLEKIVFEKKHQSLIQREGASVSPRNQASHLQSKSVQIQKSFPKYLTQDFLLQCKNCKQMNKLHKTHGKTRQHVTLSEFFVWKNRHQLKYNFFLFLKTADLVQLSTKLEQLKLNLYRPETRRLILSNEPVNN